MYIVGHCTITKIYLQLGNKESVSHTPHEHGGRIYSVLVINLVIMMMILLCYIYKAYGRNYYIYTV
jgi:hypothetical protein